MRKYALKFNQYFASVHYCVRKLLFDFKRAASPLKC